VLAHFADRFAVESTMLMIFFPKTFNVIQHCSDLSHASSGAGKQGKCSESCFVVFLQEQEHRKQGPKGRENKEKRNFSKENALVSAVIQQSTALHLAGPSMLV